MPELAANRAAILAAVQSVLAAVTTPKLSVIQGMPWSINTDRSCFWWYAGDGTNVEMGGRTLSSRAISEKFLISVYWQPPQAQQPQTAMVQEAWDASRSIQQGLAADVTLGGLLGGLELEDARAGLWQHFSGLTYYALEIPVSLWVPDADTEGR